MRKFKLFPILLVSILILSLAPVPKAHAAEDLVSAVIQIARHARIEAQVAHQDEEGDDRERIGRGLRVHDVFERYQRGLETSDEPDTEEADCHHADTYIHAHDEQNKEHGDSDQSYGHIRHIEFLHPVDCIAAGCLPPGPIPPGSAADKVPERKKILSTLDMA